MGGNSNNVLMTVLSMSLKEYLIRYTDDRKTETVTIAFPFSIRPPLRHVLDFDFNNQYALLPLRLRLVDDYETGFKQIKGEMDKVKHSLTPFAMIFMIKCIMSMPHIIREAVINDYTKRITFVISNVPGPRKALTIAGCKTHSQGFFVPALKTVVGGISILSHADVVKICISTDQAIMEHP
jgi:diacylglycerol O-acyltransferase